MAYKRPCSKARGELWRGGDRDTDQLVTWLVGLQQQYYTDGR